MTKDQGHSVLVQLDDAVGYDADGAALGISSYGRYTQAAVLLISVDAKPVVAVGELEVGLGLEALDRFDNAVGERL